MTSLRYPLKDYLSLNNFSKRNVTTRLLQYYLRWKAENIKQIGDTISGASKLLKVIQEQWSNMIIKNVLPFKTAVIQKIST